MVDEADLEDVLGIGSSCHVKVAHGVAHEEEVVSVPKLFEVVRLVNDVFVLVEDVQQLVLKTIVVALQW